MKLQFIHLISPVFDTNTFDLKYEHSMDILFEGTKYEVEKDIINTLGIAVAFDVPIYPNTLDAEEHLAYYYQKLIKEGFTAPNEKGEDVRLRPTNVKSINEFKIENFSSIDLTKLWSPSDLILLKNIVKNELEKLNNAKNTLSTLEIAIKDLEELLLLENRNENALQRCLTQNPILFGLDYIEIIPKHKLGAEYEVDYALRKHSGLIDLMEIESSTLPLFTKSGNPSSYLVHAEQQVIDWLDWIEESGTYARINLKGLISPKGFVVIGRNSVLNEKTKKSLIRRNKAFNGLITIMTYDELLERAKGFFQIISS